MKFGLDVLTLENFPHLPVLIWSKKKKTTTLPHCGLISPHGAVSVCCTMKWTKAKSTKHGFFRRPPTSCFSAGPQDENKNKSGDGSCLPPLVLEYSVTCDSSRTFSCKSQRRNSLTIDSDSLISLMAPYHSLRWMDVRGCARSNIVTSSPYWLNIQYECIMRHCSPHSSYIRARQNETCCCFTLFFFLSLATFEVISCCTNFLWCLFATVCVDFHKSLDSPLISLCFAQKTGT